MDGRSGDRLVRVAIPSGLKGVIGLGLGHLVLNFRVRCQRLRLLRNVDRLLDWVHMRRCRSWHFLELVDARLQRCRR